MKTFNGSRLKEARYFNSRSITELAKELGVSKQMVSKYENGKGEPLPETFFKLVKALGFPAKFYFGTDKVKVKSIETFYRSRFTATQKQKSPSEFLKKLAYYYRDFLEDYLDFPSTTLPESFMEEVYDLYEQKKIEQIAQNLREYWNLGSNPIPDMVNLLERKGFVVCDIPTAMDKVDAFGGGVGAEGREYYIIFLDTKETDFFKRQFSAAHELGHWILHSGIVDPQDLEPAEYRNIEQEANDFASAFLLPAHQFIKEIGEEELTLNYVLSLRSTWYVSMAALLMRAKKLHVITEEAYVKFQKQISYRKWRKHEPNSELFELKHPRGLVEGTELLVSEGILSREEIPYLLEERFDRAYPSLIMEKVVGLPEGYFATKGGNIINLKANNIS